MLVDLILEYVKVIGGCHSDDVLKRMPGSVENFLAKVQAVHTDFIFATLSAHTHLPWFQDRPRLAVLPGRLQSHVTLRITVEHSEEVVVRTSHDHTGNRTKQNINNIHF